MLKLQRAAGLLLVAVGAAAEGFHFAGALPLDAAIGAHCSMVFGAALYAMTMTGGKAEALLALAPVPVLAPAAAVLLAWRRGHLPRHARAPRRLVGPREGLALALGLAAVGTAAAQFPPARFLLGEPEPPLETVTYGIELVDESPFRMTFERGSRDMTPEAEAVLHRAVAAFNQTPDTTMVVSGSKASFEPYDVALAAERAEAVRARLVYLYGISGSRIRTGDYFTANHREAGAVEIRFE
jgi:hypothetical protein